MSESKPTSPGQHPAEMSPLGRLAGFLFFSAIGVATLAAAALLPEYAALADLRAQRDALAHQVDCEERLAVYNHRLIQGAQDDPVLVARLMMRHGNYRLAGCVVRDVPATGAVESVPERLLRESLSPPAAPPDELAQAGRWMDEPSIRGGLVLVGLGVLAVGAILFGPDRRPLLPRG